MIYEPTIRKKTKLVEPFTLDSTIEIKLPSPIKLGSEFISTLEERSSKRYFSPPNIEDIGGLLFYTCRVKSADINDYGEQVFYTNVGSPGALNAISILVCACDGSWFAYDPVRHSLKQLEASASCQKLYERCHGILSTRGTASLIWCVADMTLLKSKYENPETLALRHSGGISATLALVAQALGLSFCQLGICGVEEATLLSDKRELLGVGTSLFGRHPDDRVFID
ncbi:SagB/ThcOx family dehydrogenase [Vibrio coralliilyticus]|nr:SagB/ThcOx family dehydrogenase [Vibrio coralliilyticus]